MSDDSKYKKIWDKLRGDVQSLIDNEDFLTRRNTDNIGYSRSAGRYSAFCHIQRIMDLYENGRIKVL